MQMNTEISTGIPAQVLLNLKHDVSVRTHFSKVCEHTVFMTVYLGKQQVSEELNMSTSRVESWLAVFPAEFCKAFNTESLYDKTMDF